MSSVLTKYMPLPSEGIVSALWTPTDEQGALLETELREQIARLVRAGVHGLMVLGSTGDFVHFDVPVRKRVAEIVREAAPGLPLMINVSDIRPRVVADLGRHARSIGADSVAILPPWYFHLSQCDLVEFFVRSAEAAGLPAYLYNFPERTGHVVTLDTIRKVAARVPVPGVKQSGADFDYHRDLVELGKELNFVVLSGCEPRLPDSMAWGVRGCISGLSNATPEALVRMYDLIKAGADQEARELAQLLGKLIGIIDRISFPLNVAAAMEARQWKPGAAKALVSPETRAHYGAVVQDVLALQAARKLW